MSEQLESELCHELMDRSYMQYEVWMQFITDHPACAANGMIEQAQEIQDKMWEFYQQTSLKCFN